MSAMQVLILSDGVPGHIRSSLGILAAFAKHRKVEAHVLPIRETRRGSRRVKRTLAGLIPFEAFWKAFYRIETAETLSAELPLLQAIPSDRVDVVISTGPRTAAANIALARRLKAKNVYFGFPRWPSDGRFSVLLTPERRSTHPHVAYALRPSALDPQGLSEARALVPGEGERRAALLFGGHSKHYAYATSDMELLAERLVGLARAMRWLRWTVYDSRRTDRASFDRFVERVTASGEAVDIVRFAEQGLTSNDAAFSCDFVLVTADSMSMLSESVAARRPTGMLFADGYAPPPHDRAEQQAMIADRRVFPVRFSGLTGDALLKGAAGLEPLPGSQLDVLYETLVRHGV